MKFPLRKTRSYKIRVLPLVYTFLGTLCYTYIFKYNKQDVQCLAAVPLNDFDIVYVYMWLMINILISVLIKNILISTLK